MSPREIQKRSAKAENLRVLQADDGSFYVESEKGKILYNVILDDQESSCTCGDFAKNSKRDGEFMLLSIPDGKQTFQVNGDKMTPGISISNSEVGLASLSVSAFFLRLVCTNGMVAKTEISASYRHVSTKILVGLPEVFEKVSYELGGQRDRLRLSLESPVDDPLATLDRFNKQFQLKEPEREAVAWGWSQEAGDTMFHVVNTYTRAAAMDGLTAESSYRLQKVGGEVLGMLD